MDEGVAHPGPGGSGCKNFLDLLRSGGTVSSPLRRGDVGRGPLTPAGTGEIPQFGHPLAYGNETSAASRRQLVVPTYWGGSGGVSTVAYRSVYYPTTEHDSPIHQDKADIWDMCGDGEDARIVSSHALIGSGGDQL